MQGIIFRRAGLVSSVGGRRIRSASAKLAALLNAFFFSRLVVVTLGNQLLGFQKHQKCLD